MNAEQIGELVAMAIKFAESQPNEIKFLKDEINRLESTVLYLSKQVRQVEMDMPVKS